MSYRGKATVGAGFKFDFMRDPFLHADLASHHLSRIILNVATIKLTVAFVEICIGLDVYFSSSAVERVGALDGVSVSG